MMFKNNLLKKQKVRLLSLCIFILVGCSTTPVKTSQKHIANKEWIKAVIEYRKAVDRDPDNVEYRSQLEQIELKAAEYYYQQGHELQERGDFDKAETAYEQSILAKKEHSKSSQALRQLSAIKESAHAYREANQLAQAGKNQDAIKLLKRAIDVYSKNQLAKALLKSLENESRIRQQEEGLPFNQEERIVLNFRGTQTRAAFEFLGKTNNFNIIFDEDVKSSTLTLFAKDVTFEQALNLMLKTTQTFYKKVSAKTFIIIPDSAEKRRQYEDYVIKTFYLNVVRAKEIVEVIKGLIKVNSIIINEQLNSIVVRDTEEVVGLINKIVESNDRKPAEMILEVEILEVNRSKAERLGMDFGGYQIGSSIPASEVITAQSDIATVYGSVATLTLPALTFRFYKQDVDAKILANPKIRVLDSKTAKIHIGDRVPLRASTITDATGQVRTTFDYKEIGIKLVAEPHINLDN
ncbi:MAG: hypothetical protein OEY29_15945, partial [Gammaproteobacteria bacterium]|nr:hypothetical protein [Gammaproteobacteria bacterium]